MRNSKLFTPRAVVALIATATCALSVAHAAPPDVGARPEAKSGNGVLQPVGTLACDVRLKDQPALPPTLGLQCRLRMEAADKEPISITGEMVGADLYVRDPGAFALTFAVLAPEGRIGRENLGGDYDITTSHPYELARTADDVLFGGEGDRLALRLKSSGEARISPSTRLTLTLVRPNG